MSLIILWNDFLLSISQYRKMPYIFDGTCNANVAHMCNILHVYSLFVIALFAYEAIVLNVYANSYQCLCSGRGKHLWCGMNALCGAINNECWFIAIPLYWYYISAYSNIWHIIKRPHRRNEIQFHSWPNAWLQQIRHGQLQDETKTINVLGFGGACIIGLTVYSNA